MSLKIPSNIKMTRRGAALLVVLATLILVMTSSVSLVNIASTNKLNRNLNQTTKQADDLLTASNDAIISWLSKEAGQVVLPPEVLEPRVDLLHDSWITNDVPCELRITAWDQCGMVPIELAKAGSPLRLALSTEIIAAIDKVKIKRNQQPGLDQFINEYPEGVQTRVFPLPRLSQPVVHIDPLVTLDVENVSSQLHYQDEENAATIGSVVATYSSNTINLNTTPIPVIEQALRSAGRGGLEVIIAARAEGRSANPGDLSISQSSNKQRIKLTNSSNAWSFRIDIRIGSLKRSWWTIFTKTKSTWECTQRLAITQ